MKKSETNLFRVSVQYTVYGTKEIRIPKEFEDSKKLRAFLQIYCQENFDMNDYEILDTTLDDYETQIDFVNESDIMSSFSNELLEIKCNPKELSKLPIELFDAEYEPYYLFEKENTVKCK
jgi:hypothetical protein